MKFTFVCPKCESNQIAGPHRIHAYRGHARIDLPGLSTATFEAYTCVTCGFTEFYVDKMGRFNIEKSGRIRTSYEASTTSIRKRTKYQRKKICLVCNSELSEDSERCENCGSRNIRQSQQSAEPSIPEKKYCPICQSEILDETEYCDTCGSKIE